jgi:Fe-S oxidoreductase
MQFSQKSKEHMDSCRFCWMCRHICPIGNATGQERNTARARALGLSLVARDAVEYSEDIINNVYECALCGACVKECVTGWDPVMFTKEARLAAALDGKLPEYIITLLSNLQDNGNIYAAEKDAALTDAIKQLAQSDTLLFLGEDARFKAPQCAVNAIELLRKSGVSFTVLDDEPNSGYSSEFMLGAAAETKSVMEACAKAVSGFKKVVCYDPADAKIMKREYKEWGIELKPEVVTFTEFVAALIKDDSLAVKNSSMCFTPQDSFFLARDLEETEPIREILSACGTVNEMLLNRKDTMLAGNLIMNEYMPDVIERVAADRWTNAENMGAKILVTESVAEYVMMAKTKPENIEVMTIEEAVLKCL